MSAPMPAPVRRLVALGLASGLLAACASETSSPGGAASIVTTAPATEPTPTAPTAPPAAPPPPAATPANPSTPPAPSDPGAAPVPVVATKRVFVTSGAFTADLKTQGNGADGFDGADKLCTNAAAAAGLTGTFRAFLSGKHAGADVAAPSRVPPAGAWVTLDGQLLFLDPAELTGSPRAPITMTETRQSLGSASVWTATNVGKLAGSACEDAAGESWTSTTAATPAATGLTSASLQWTFAAPSACTATAHLYCFED